MKDHQQVLVEHPIFRFPVMVDEGVHDTLAILWDNGIPTFFSCQGDPDDELTGLAYVVFPEKDADRVMGLFPNWKLDDPNPHAYFPDRAAARWKPEGRGSKPYRCAVEGCTRKLYAYSLCRPHRWMLDALIW